MTTYFETKEQYLTFRKAWTKAVNDDRAKKTLREEKVKVGKTIYINKYRDEGWITSTHHVLFNLLCQRPIDNGFTPVTNRNKLSHGMAFNGSLCQAVYQLKKMYTIAHNKVNEAPVEDWKMDALKKFLFPITEHLDNTDDLIQALAKVRTPDVKGLYSNWADGAKVAKIIIDGEAKPTTFAELEKLYNEVA